MALKALESCSKAEQTRLVF